MKYIYRIAPVFALLVIVVAALFGFPSARAESLSAPALRVFPDPDGRPVVCYTFEGVFNLPPSCVYVPSSAATEPTATPRPVSTATPSVTPTRTPTASPVSQVNLANPGFELGLAHWNKFTQQTTASNPLEFNLERLSNGAHPDIVRSGDASARIKSQWQCWQGGLYQQVEVPPFTRIRFSFYGLTWGASTDNFNLPSDPNLYSYLDAGIDSQGGTDARNSGVRWSGRGGYDGFHLPGGEPSEVTVEAVALANKVTIFLRASLGIPPAGGCVWPYQSMIAVFDDARIEVVP